MLHLRLRSVNRRTLVLASIAFLAAAGLAAIFWPTRNGNPPVVAVALTPVLQAPSEMLDPSKLNLNAASSAGRAEHHSTAAVGSFGDLPAAEDVKEFPQSPLEPRAGFNDFPEAYDAPIVRASGDEKGFDDGLKKSTGQDQSGNGNSGGGGRRYGASAGFGGSIAGGSGGAGASGMGRSSNARESAPIVVPANNQRLIVAAEAGPAPRTGGGSGSSASFDPNQPFGDGVLAKATNPKLVLDPTKLVGQNTNAQHMPEPGSLLLLAGGGAAACARTWKKRRSRS